MAFADRSKPFISGNKFPSWVPKCPLGPEGKIAAVAVQKLQKIARFQTTERIKKKIASCYVDTSANMTSSLIQTIHSY